MKDKILEEDLLYIANAGGDYEKLYGKSILITGATGLVGSQIVKALLKMNEVKNADITIYAFVRNAEKADKIYDEFAKDKLVYVIGDVGNPVTDETVPCQMARRSRKYRSTTSYMQQALQHPSSLWTIRWRRS